MTSLSSANVSVKENLTCKDQGPMAPKINKKYVRIQKIVQNIEAHGIGII